jgi:hypothetical protein
VVALLGLSTSADPDLWGHLLFGLDAVRDHVLPRVDVYSFTQDRPQLYHEWGGAVLLAIAWRAAGMAGLVAMKFVIVASALALVWLLLRDVRTWVRIALILLVATAALPITGTFRPQLFSWLLTAAMFVLLPLPRGRRAVPLLFVAWANLHGGWLVGLGVLGVWTVGERTREAWAVWLASAAATLATPYGIHLWQFIAGTVRLGRTQITEWQPLWTAPPETWIPWFVACALVLFAAWRRRMAWPTVVGSLVLAYASQRVLRLVPFFVLTVVIWTARSYPAQLSRPLGAAVRRLEMASAAIILLLVLWTRWSSVSCWDIGKDWAPDLSVELDAQGNLLVPFTWGEYAMWRWGPRLRVSIDGRRETLYSDAVVDPQFALEDNDRAGLPWLASASPDVVWHRQTATLVRQTLISQGYRVVLDAPRSYVLAKPGVPVQARLRAEPKCFPAD